LKGFEIVGTGKLCIEIVLEETAQSTSTETTDSLDITDTPDAPAPA